jgi:putative membrane protein
MFVGKFFILGAAVLLAQQRPTTSPSTSTTSTSSSASTASTQDKDWINQVAMDNHQEIMMARLGEQKASNAGVKSFAQKLATDHTKALSELETVARGKSVTIPSQYTSTSSTSTTSSTATQNADERRLSGLSGAEFDRAFVKQMVDDHQKAISAFEREEKATQDSAIRNYINTTLPTLRSHLSEAQNLEKTLGRGE